MTITDLVYIDSTGYHFADYPAFLLWIKGVYQTIYGEDAYLEADSQDGQFLQILAQAFYDTASVGASVDNSFSPKTAQGVGLARVVKINGITKKIATYSTVTVTIVGTADTPIENGITQDTLNQKWILPALLTIPTGGSIDVTATAEFIGAVFAEPGTITKIFTPTNGWQTVTNAFGAAPGAPVESDANLRLRQAQSTSLPAQTPFDATLGVVANTAGVTKVQGFENYTDVTDAISLPPHSICVAVVGGADLDIANAIMSKKTPGTNPRGNTGPIVVTDARGMNVNIYFTRAVTAQIQATINVVRGVGWSPDFVTLIQQAVAASINSGGIGSVVYFTALFCPALLTGTPSQGTFSISSLTLGKNGGGQSAANIVLAQGINAENPVCDPAVDVTVNVT